MITSEMSAIKTERWKNATNFSLAKEEIKESIHISRRNRRISLESHKLSNGPALQVGKSYMIVAVMGGEAERSKRKNAEKTFIAGY